jgi:flagellar basal body-associated protein FliL
MADDTKKTDDAAKKEEPKAKNKNEKAAGSSSILSWIIIAVIVVVCAGAGFSLGKLLAGSQKHETADPNKAAHKAAEPAKAENLKAEGSAPEAPKAWYFDLDPVVANLDEPGVTRYIRVTLTLEVDQEIDKKKGEEFLKEKKPVLTNWLAIYLAGLGLDDIRGNKNHMRIQSQILDAFNEKLFPGVKPQIKHILFKEFAVQ